MMRYLSIALVAGLLGVVLWLPAHYPAVTFYRAVHADHIAFSGVWGQHFASSALESTLTMPSIKPTRPKDVPLASGPTGLAERRLAIRMQGIVDRIYGSPYLQAVDAMTALAMYRLNTLGYLTGGIGLLLVPAIIDALMRRVIRTHEFRRHDPERYTLGLAVAMTMAAALLGSCAVPLTLSPFWSPIAMLAAVYCLHVVIANFHHSAI